MPVTYTSPSKTAVITWFLPLLLLGAAITFLVWRHGLPSSQPNQVAEARLIEARGPLVEEEKNNIAVYERTAPTVVHVTNLRQFKDKLSLNVQEIPKGTGSGFIWDENGHIVTCYHVVSDAEAAKVILADHSSYDVRKIMVCPDKDIAVLKIAAPKSKLRPLPIGTSHDLKVGQISYAIGNPFGLDQSMTVGIVSALGRAIQSKNGYAIQGAIQTCAAINPGNSGGPLLDSAGRLIGMNTAILSPSGAFAGIGFAIPVYEINRIVPQLIRKGKVAIPQLGVRLADDHLAQQLGVQGALIIEVAPASPAAAAGLRGTSRDKAGQVILGDIIVAMDGTAIARAKDFYSALEQYKVGDTVTLTILRDNQRQKVQINIPAAE